MKISVSKCRKILGLLAVGKNDSEIEFVRDSLEVLAKIAIESFINKEKIAIDINNKSVVK